MSPDIVNNTVRGTNYGVVLQAGTVNGPVTFGATQAPVDFSWMLDQRLHELPDREREIDELRSFCRAKNGDSYLWVQGKSFAGKSTLLRTFAAMPHDDLVFVWFFVRRGLHDRRPEFVEVMLHQLAAVLGEGVPVVSGLAAVSVFHDLLTRAAQHCHDEERTLVLIVDGLDEEAEGGRGSIVGLLPAQPSDGLRVIVSSRPQHPRPERVVGDRDHPLLQPQIVFPLKRSDHAAIVQDEAHRDIEALTCGSKIQRRLVGVVAAARGGLTLPDLAELLKVYNDEVRAVLDSVEGRCLAGSRSLWRPGPALHRYGFDHDSLWDMAAEKIGERLSGIRLELRAWAQRWRREGWPEDTPEYLLLNYFGMLEDTADVTGMASLATDPARQARLRSLTGANATAIAEIAAVRTALLAEEEPDLALLAQLAVRHEDLRRRNAAIPPDLPAVWVKLGHVARARNLIDEVPGPRSRVTACAAVLQALGREGDRGVARRFLAVAEDSIAELTPTSRNAARAEVARALIAIGELDEARTLTEQVHPNARTEIYADLVRAAWAVEDRDLAREICCITMPPKPHARLVTTSALEIAALGGYDEAAYVVSKHIKNLRLRSDALADLVTFTAHRAPSKAQAILGRITANFPYYKIKAEIALATAHHTSGRTDDARSLLGTAEARLATPMRDESYYDGAVREVARAWVVLRDPDRAVRLAEHMRDHTTRGRNLVELVGHLVRAGFFEPARKLARGVPSVLAVVTPMRRRTDAYVDLIEAVAATGDMGLASAIATKARAAAAEVHPEHRPTVLAAIDLAMASQASPDHRAALIAELPDRHRRQAALMDLALELAETTGCQAALAAVHRVPDPVTQADVLTTLAAAADQEDALLLAKAAETAIRAAETDKARSTVRAAVARSLVHTQDYGRAATIARTIRDHYLRATTQVALAATAGPATALGIARDIDYPYYQVRALADVLRATDDPKHAQSLLDEARSALRRVDPGWQIPAHTHLAEAAVAALGLPAATGLITDAHALATAMTDLEPDQLSQAEHDKHTQAIHDLATAVARMGWHHRAARIARLIRDAYRRCCALSQVAIATAALGEVDDAIIIARSARMIAKALGDKRALAAAAQARAACAKTAPDPIRPDRSVVSQPPSPLLPSPPALAEQLTTPEWINALPLLAKTDPDALRRLAAALPTLYDEVEHEHSSPNPSGQNTRDDGPESAATLSPVATRP